MRAHSYITMGKTELVPLPIDRQLSWNIYAVILYSQWNEQFDFIYTYIYISRFIYIYIFQIHRQPIYIYIGWRISQLRVGSDSRRPGYLITANLPILSSSHCGKSYTNTGLSFSAVRDRVPCCLLNRIRLSYFQTSHSHCRIDRVIIVFELN